MTIAWRAKLPWIALGLGGALLAAAVVMLAGPAWVYAGNADEFAASVSQVLGIILPYFIGVTAVVLVALVLLPARLARYLALVLALLGAAFWIQGTFMVHDFGSLDGQSWAISLPLWRVALELAVLAIAMAAVWQLASRAPAIVAGAMVAIAVFAVAEPASKLPSSADLEDTGADEPAFQFSSEKNVLVVILDGMQSEIFDEIVDENPDIRAALDGFTYYPDTAGVAYSTVLSLPVIHSSREYDGKQVIKDYFSDTVEKGSFMNELADGGYNTTLINPLYGICPSRVAFCKRAKPILTTVGSAVTSDANKLVSIGIFRSVPYFLKDYVYNRGKWRKVMTSEDPRTVHHTIEGNTFLKEFAARAAVGSDKPTAKFLHLLSTHLPVALGQNCTYVGDQKSTRDGFKWQAQCAMRAFALMLGELKAKGIYDRTAIVLLSDHGSGGWASVRGVVSGLVRSNLIAVANPTLVVKPMGATGAMQRDNAPMSLTDVPGLVCRFVSDCAKTLADPKDRPRYYRHYAWDGSAWKQNTPIKITSYRINGPVYDSHNWEVETASDEDGEGEGG